MLHLPALVLTRQIDKVFQAACKKSASRSADSTVKGRRRWAISIRSAIRSPSDGPNEEDLVKQVADIVPVIIDYERQARGFPHQGKPREPARPRQPRLRHPANRADDQLGRDHAPAFQRPHGRKFGPHRGFGNPRPKRTLHPNSTGPSAKAQRHRTGCYRSKHRTRPLPAAPFAETHQRRRSGAELTYTHRLAGLLQKSTTMLVELARAECVQNGRKRLG